MTAYGYTPTTWVDNTTQGTHTTLNNLETQFIAALTALNEDVVSTAFVLSGYACTKDGTNANQLDVTAGIAYLVGADAHNDMVRVALTSSTQTTSTPSTTYYLFLGNTGTWQWGTSNTGPTNSILICQVTTDGSGNILVVTDERSTGIAMFPNAIGKITVPGAWGSDAGSIFSDGAGNLSLASLNASSGTADTELYSDEVLDILPGNCVGYWKLAEPSGTTANDSSGYGSVGTYHASPTLGVTGLLASDPDTCVTFASGSSQYVSLTAAELPTGASPWTIAGWVKFASNPAAIATIAMWGTGSNAAAWLFINTSGEPAVATNGTTATSASALSTGAAHFVVGTYDGSNLRLYADGSLVAGPTSAANNIGASPTANIGATTTPNQYFNGQLEKVAIYSVALTAAQITALYNLGHTAPTAGPKIVQVPGFQTKQSGGSALGIPFETWSGSAGVWNFSIGGRFKSALAWVDQSGNIGGESLATFGGITTGAISSISPATTAGAEDSLAIHSQSQTYWGVMGWGSATPGFYVYDKQGAGYVFQAGTAGSVKVAGMTLSGAAIQSTNANYIGFKDSGGGKVGEFHVSNGLTIAGTGFKTTAGSYTFGTGGSFDSFDVCEQYETDDDYAYGTVVCPGRAGVLTRCTHDGCRAAMLVSQGAGIHLGGAWDAEAEDGAHMRNTPPPGHPIALVGRILARCDRDASIPAFAHDGQPALLCSDGQGGVRAMRPGETGFSLGYALHDAHDGEIGMVISRMWCQMPAAPKAAKAAKAKAA